MTPRYSAAIVLGVFSDNPEEARDRLMPYVRAMHVQVDAIEVTDPQTGISYVFPVSRMPALGGE